MMSEFGPHANERFDIDLGDGHWLRWIVWKANEAFPTLADGERVGCEIIHATTKTETGMCSGYLGLNRAVNTEHACWNVESWDPLTLSPSVLCRGCGDHGFVRNGKWEKA